MHLNIRSHNANGNEFSALLSSLISKPEIFTLTETWLDNDSVDFCKYPGYSGYHTFRQGGRGGGVSVFVDDRLNSSFIDEISVSNVTIESCAVRIILNNVNFVILSIYRPHSDSINNFTDSLMELLSSSCFENCSIALIGDFNINLIDDNSNINNFMNNLQSSSFTQLINLPTRYPPNNTNYSPSLLDHIWTNSFNSYASGILYTDITDHLPIFAHFDFNYEINNLTKITFRYHNEESFEGFVSDLMNVDWNPILSLETNLVAENIENVVNDLYCRNFQLKTKFISQKRFQKPWLSNSLLKCIKNKSKYFKLFKIGSISHSFYSNYRNTLTKLLRHSRNEYYSNYFKNNIKDCRKIWSKIREISGKYKDSNVIKEILVDNTNLVRNDLDISELFNNHFSNIGQKLDEMLPEVDINPCNFIKKNIISSFYLRPVIPEEVNAILSNLKLNKCSKNIIPVSIMKKVSSILSVPLAHLINKSFRSGIFPEIFKTATITPIHKKGPQNEIQNYRPISILPTYSKIIEKCMSSRLVNYLEKCDILCSNQFGFRSGLSTNDAIAKFVEDIYDSFNNKKHTISIFLDFKNAFDTVNHKILLDKLYRYGIRGVANEWFKNYLSNMKQRVRIRNSFSECMNVWIGLLKAAH